VLDIKQNIVFYSTIESVNIPFLYKFIQTHTQVFPWPACFSDITLMFGRVYQKRTFEDNLNRIFTGCSTPCRPSITVMLTDKHVYSELSGGTGNVVYLLFTLVEQVMQCVGVWLTECGIAMNSAVLGISVPVNLGGLPIFVYPACPIALSPIHRTCQKKDWSSHKLACEKCGDPVGCPFMVSVPQSKAKYSYLYQLLHDYTRCARSFSPCQNFFCSVYCPQIGCWLMKMSTRQSTGNSVAGKLSQVCLIPLVDKHVRGR